MRETCYYRRKSTNDDSAFEFSTLLEQLDLIAKEVETPQ